MIVSLVLGMGLPTTGAYILAAALGVPILTTLGFPAISAHMFVFYYAIISNITPPVALRGGLDRGLRAEQDGLHRL